jgi:hypothetical protein
LANEIMALKKRHFNYCFRRTPSCLRKQDPLNAAVCSSRRTIETQPASCRWSLHKTPLFSQLRLCFVLAQRSFLCKIGAKMAFFAPVQEPWPFQSSSDHFLNASLHSTRIPADTPFSQRFVNIVPSRTWQFPELTLK